MWRTKIPAWSCAVPSAPPGGSTEYVLLLFDSSDFFFFLSGCQRNRSKPPAVCVCVWMCVDVYEYAIGLNITSKVLVIPSQNASGPGLDPVVPLGKQLDRERIHGKLLRNNLCVSVVCLLLLLSSVSHFNSRGISVSSVQYQK